MKNRRRIGCMGLMAMLLISSLTGCGDTKIVVTTGLAPNELFRIGNVSCAMPEALVYLNNQKNQYENIYGIEMWDHAFGDTTLEEYLKSQVLSQLAQMKSMVYLAKERDIALSEEDEQKAEKAASEYFASLSQEEIKLLGVDEDAVKSMYEDYCLAQEAYDKITEDVTVEVSDDESRVIQLDQIYVQEQSLAEELKGRLDQGEDFETLAGHLFQGAEGDRIRGERR